MAEVIATFAALSSVLQVIDFTTKATKYAIEFTKKGKDCLRENDDLERLAAEYRALSLSSCTGTSTEPETTAVSNLRQQCLSEADKLIAQLQRLKITPGVKGVALAKDVTRKAVRAASEEKKVEKHLGRLRELNGLLGTRILERLTEAHGLKSSEWITRLTSTDQAFEKLASDEQFRTLKREQDKFVQERNDHILSSLHFAGLNERQEIIAESYPETYHWAVERDQHRLQPWLRNGDGIFWISGKPGSGKSTLMKFLGSSPETASHLRKWAQGSNVVCKSFYFWYAGSTLQKSVEGLLRSILHQTLRDSQDLLPILFPSQYQRPIKAPADPIPRTVRALCSTIEALVSYARPGQPPVKYCFFIDALDEYHGNGLELIRIVRSLASNANTKICVSSRPWNAFRDAFELNVPNLRLEDLTYSDIHTYVAGNVGLCYRETTGGTEIGSEVKLLIDEITAKAEGVFLWIYLVVSSVMKGILEGDPVSMLRHRVQEFPADLEDFFRNILDRVDSVYKHQTAQALTLAYLCVKEKDEFTGQHTWVDYWLIHQDFHGISPGLVYNLVVAERTRSDFENMLAQTRRFISASCKDLLMLSGKYGEKSASLPSRPDMKVTFLHRTVHEFLQTDYMQSLLRQQTRDVFASHRMFHLLNLARLTLISADEDSYEHVHLNLKEVARMSLTPLNTDLCSSYVGQFEKVILSQRKTRFLPQPLARRGMSSDQYDDQHAHQLIPAVLVPLLAFQKYQLPISILKNVLQREAYDTNRVAQYLVSGQHDLFDLTSAACGSHSLHQFPIYEVHMPLIEILISLRGRFVKVLWQTFMMKWYTDRSKMRSESDLRQCWDIAKLCLLSGAELEREFINPLEELHGVKAVVEPAIFLEAQVPQEWLGEMPLLRRQAKQRNTEQNQAH